MAIKTLLLSAVAAAIISNYYVNWSAPTQREDGSNLEPNEISEYHVYWGYKEDYQNEIRVPPNVLTVSLPVTTTKMICAVVTAIDLQGRESLYSTKTCYNGYRPSQPIKLRVR